MRQFSDPTYQFVRSHSMKITSKRSGGEGGGEGSGSEGGGGNGGGKEAGGGGLAANRTPRPDMLVPKASPIMSAHAPIDASCDRRTSAPQLQDGASAAVAAVTPKQRRHSHEVQPAAAKKVANKEADEPLRRERRHTFHTLPAERPPGTSKSRSQPPRDGSPAARRETAGNPPRGSPNQSRSLTSSPQLRHTICSSSAVTSCSTSSSTSPSPKPQARSLGGSPSGPT